MSHETKDFKPVYIAMFVGILVYAIVALYLFAWGIFSHLTQPAAAPPVDATLFPQPRLQIDPQTDLSQLQAQEHERLATYGWIDRNSGTVRIPIDRAMDLVAERGLPHFPAPPNGATK